jgi:cytochrome c oxidase subunit II
VDPGREHEPPAPMPRRDAVRLLLLGTVLSLIGVALSLAIDWFPAQAAESANDIDVLYDVLLAVSVPIFVLVMTIAIYSVVRWRARPGQRGDGAPVHGNTKLEVIWVTIPFIIVTALAIYAWVVLDQVEERQDGEMVVDVTGLQFSWQFAYPEQRVRSNELVVPIGQPLRFDITANDVIHSFWVPEFRLKQDAVPRLETQIRLTPNRTGRWQVVCAELCGIGHATMRVPVRVVQRAEFDRWVADRRKLPSGRTTADAEPGSPETAE